VTVARPLSRPLARPPAAQLARLDAVPLEREFPEAVGRPLSRSRLRIIQVNLGKLCNMSCRHCHVDAGPDRTERMDDDTLSAVLRLIAASDAPIVDVTGGAPELHPRFRDLVQASVDLGKQVIDRCNLSVLLLAPHADLPGWLGERGVEIVASLPHDRQAITDAQRGDGAFRRSIEALRRLNAAGYGQGDPRRRLTLMHNPGGAYLPGGQASMAREWRASLAKNHGVQFDRLIALNNMPIARFLDWLEASSNTDAYVKRLAAAFNPAAVDGLMCRDTLSIGWDGRLYDCDFNQMLELPLGVAANLRDLDLDRLEGAEIRTARHCFGCTAGAGSGCGGAIT
jgi:radical SAM/Cys-rich protein